MTKKMTSMARAGETKIHPNRFCPRVKALRFGRSRDRRLEGVPVAVALLRVVSI